MQTRTSDSPFIDNSPHAKQIRDMMWSFFWKGKQKSNIPALKEAVNTLINAATQKTAGQREAKKNDVDWRELDMVLWEIIIEATALVVSGDLDRLEAADDTD